MMSKSNIFLMSQFTTRFSYSLLINAEQLAVEIEEKIKTILKARLERRKRQVKQVKATALSVDETGSDE